MLTPDYAGLSPETHRTTRHPQARPPQEETPHLTFLAYLAFASTLGEERMSHTAWTGMLAPALLDILVEANKVAGLDGAKAHRCLLRQVKLFATATRDLYRT